jgi:hypothetical protein
MATLEKESNISDSHWYTVDGKPAYSIVGKNGQQRPTTLRDARKLALLPSVTTIFNIMAKHGLEKWKITKAIEAALTTPKDDGEPEERWHERIMERSKLETTEAAEFGTKVHNAIENFLTHRAETPYELIPFVSPAVNFIYNDLNMRDIVTEAVCVNAKEGYAGRVDVSGIVGSNELNIPNCSRLVLDFKTRKTTEGIKVTPYDFQPTQIAAYAMGIYGSLDNVYGANLYISTTEVGRIEIVIYDPSKLYDEYLAFMNMTALWRFIKNFDPRRHENLVFKSSGSLA